MSDPLTDPRAVALLRADPGEVAALAGTFRRVASQSQTAASGLRGAHDAHWESPAADAFREKLGKLPSDLDKVHQSYSGVADALTGYEGELGPIQVRFQNLRTQLQDARNRLGTAQGQLSSAQGNLDRASHAKGATDTSAPVISAHSAVTQATGALNQVQGEVQGLERRGFQILDDFDHVRGQARTAVSHAAGIAPQHHSSWFSSVCHAVGDFVAGAAKSVYHDVTDLPHAIRNVWDHPGSLAAWGELGKDLATTASVVAIVAAPFAAPEVLEVDGLAEGAADAAGEAAGEAAGDGAGDAASTAAKGFGRLRTPAARNISKWSGKATTGFGLGQTGTEFGQGDWKGGLTDLAFTALPSAGSFGKAASEIKGIDSPKTFGKALVDGFNGIKTPGDLVADKLGIGEAAVDTSKEASQAFGKAAETVRDYRLNRALGLNKAFAMSNTFHDGLPEALHGLNIDDASALAAHGKSLVAQANSDAAKALHLGRPVAGAVDKLVAEPIKDRIHDQISPQPAGAG